MEWRIKTPMKRKHRREVASFLRLLPQNGASGAGEAVYMRLWKKDVKRKGHSKHLGAGPAMDVVKTHP